MLVSPADQYPDGRPEELLPLPDASLREARFGEELSQGIDSFLLVRA